jgi:hypothetical protein
LNSFPLPKPAQGSAPIIFSLICKLFEI